MYSETKEKNGITYSYWFAAMTGVYISTIQMFYYLGKNKLLQSFSVVVSHNSNAGEVEK